MSTVIFIFYGKIGFFMPEQISRLEMDFCSLAQHSNKFISQEKEKCTQFSAWIYICYYIHITIYTITQKFKENQINS